jgi:hypothetical protein
MSKDKTRDKNLPAIFISVILLDASHPCSIKLHQDEK